MQCSWALAALAVLSAGAVQAQSRAIKGTVSDVATGEPVAGARAQVSGTDLSVLSGADGTFTISGAPAGAVEVVVSGANYRSARVALAGDQSEVKVGLQREMAEEIIVTGRASTTTRQHVAVSVARVNSEDLNDVPAQTVDQALQGKVTGANIQRNDGAPGGGAQVRLRGTSSIYASARPSHPRCCGRIRSASPPAFPVPSERPAPREWDEACR